MAYTYAAPGITISQLGTQTPVTTGPAPRTIMPLATFPQGPRFPVLVNSSDLPTVFGDPSSSASLGYTGPFGCLLAASQQQRGTQPPLFLVCRVGVQTGTRVIQDASAGTVVTLSAEGRFAGTRSANLKVRITGTGASMIIDLVDGPTGNTLQSFPATLYNLATPTPAVAIAQAINGANPLNDPASIVSAVAGASTLAPAALTLTAFSAGASDGAGAAYGDSTAAGLLANSLWAHVDYIWPAFDIAQIGSVLASHLNTAVAQAELRKVVGGPTLGTTYASLSSTYNAIASSRFSALAHDSLYGIDPVTGVSTLMHGFLGAAALAGMKAAGIPAETGVGFPLSGLSRIGTPPDLSAPPSPSQQQALGQAGLAYLKQPFGRGAITIGDFVTTAPYLVTSNKVNPFYQMSIQDADDAILAAGTAALQPWVLRPSSSDQGSVQFGIQSDVNGAVNALGQAAHNGINSVNTTMDPTTTAPSTLVNYQARWPFGSLSISTGFTIG